MEEKPTANCEALFVAVKSANKKEEFNFEKITL